MGNYDHNKEQYKGVMGRQLQQSMLQAAQIALNNLQGRYLTQLLSYVSFAENFISEVQLNKHFTRQEQLAQGCIFPHTFTDYFFFAIFVVRKGYNTNIFVLQTAVKTDSKQQLVKNEKCKMK